MQLIMDIAALRSVYTGQRKVVWTGEQSSSAIERPEINASAPSFCQRELLQIL